MSVPSFHAPVLTGGLWSVAAINSQRATRGGSHRRKLRLYIRLYCVPYIKKPYT